MSENTDNWKEYSKLVLKELETLARGIDELKVEIRDIYQNFAVLQNHSTRIEDLQKWQSRINDVASPIQLKDHIETIADLKSFKIKAITIFAVIQFIMAAAVFIMEFFK